MGPCTAAMRCSTSCTTSPALLVTVISVEPCRVNHRPQQRNSAYDPPPVLARCRNERSNAANSGGIVEGHRRIGAGGSLPGEARPFEPQRARQLEQLLGFGDDELRRRQAIDFGARIDVVVPQPPVALRRGSLYRPSYMPSTATLASPAGECSTTSSPGPTANGSATSVGEPDAVALVARAHLDMSIASVPANSRPSTTPVGGGEPPRPVTVTDPAEDVTLDRIERRVSPSASAANASPRRSPQRPAPAVGRRSATSVLR